MNTFLPTLALGLVTSLHCVSMCGPMVVSYALKGTEDGTWYSRIAPNLAYQVAKISSYIIVGVLLGAIGSAFKVDAVRPYVMVLAGVFMVVLGLGMTGRFPWALKITPRPPKFLMRAVMNLRRTANAQADEGKPSLATPVMFGLLTGLFPCAPLMSAQLLAAASGSALNGGLTMLAFGLGTAPLMLVFGTASSLLPQKIKQQAMALLAVVVIVFGVVYLNRGAMLLGSPVTAQSLKAAVAGAAAPNPQPVAVADAATTYTKGADGVVEIPLTIKNTQFVPSTVTIPADVPVRLVVDRQEASACSDQIAVPQLNVLKDLAPNAVTKVDLPAAKAGTYTLTCGMGMMSGQLVVGGGAGAAGAVGGAGTSSRLPLLLISLLGLGGVLYYVFGRKPTTASKKGASRKKNQKHTSTMLGLPPREAGLALAALTAAIIAGLTLGGVFSR